MEEHPLDSCYVKVERAKELVETLAAEIGEIGATTELSGYGRVNKKTGEQALLFSDLPTWPPKWSAIVGEIAHNARSALDHLVFQLAGGPEGKRTAFPIAIKESDYFERRGRRPSYRDSCLRGVDPVWVDKVDDLQPFRHPGSHLAVLNWLSNRDKHRIDHVCFSVIGTPIGTVTVDTARVKDLELRLVSKGEVETRLKTRGPRQKGERLIGNLDPQRRSDRISLEIAFGNRCVSIQGLVNVIVEVESILDRFKPAFDPTSPAD